MAKNTKEEDKEKPVSRKSNKNIMIIAGVVVVLVIILLVIYMRKPTVEETVQVFSLVSATWSDANLYSGSGCSVGLCKNDKLPLNWNILCGNCKNLKNCLNANWYVEIDASKDLCCTKKVDGVEAKNTGNVYACTDVPLGKSMTYLSLQTLDFSKNHEVTFCCKSADNPEEVCQSITLPLKC